MTTGLVVSGRFGWATCGSALSAVSRDDLNACLAGRQEIYAGAEAGAVPPVGLEPTTFGLKVRSSVIVWLEHADVFARSWLTRCASIASNSAIAGIASNVGSKGALR